MIDASKAGVKVLLDYISDGVVVYSLGQTTPSETIAIDDNN